jgi:hypothetical protein
MKDALSAINKATAREVRIVGVVGRLVARSQYVDSEVLERVLTRIEELKNKYSVPFKEWISPVDPRSQGVVPKEKVVAPTISIQQRILDSARKFASDVEGAIDEYLVNKTPFSMKTFLLANQVSGAVAKKISEFYAPQAAELEEALLGTDPQLKEGYSHMSKRELKAFAGFMRQIVNDCDQQIVSAKASKPRVTRTKSPSVIAKKVVYLKDFEPLKLKSVTPDKIVGANELWLYNTVSRKLIVFYGADGGQLTVSGMSVANYDVAKSESKTIRKPEEFFKGLSSMGKRAMANAWKSINSKPTSPRPRINSDMIILAAN